jgi:type II secretory pathway predicted ATPase ExeA
MYDDFYGLAGRPFQLTPDPRFYFESGTHRKALSYLGYGLAQGEGFIVITGEVGAGKSTHGDGRPAATHRRPDRHIRA